MENLVPVERIQEGQFFKKRGGIYAYLRISDSSAKFIGLDPAFIYGVCFNGNVAKVNLGVKVLPATVEDFQANIQKDAMWHKTIGAQS